MIKKTWVALILLLALSSCDCAQEKSTVVKKANDIVSLKKHFETPDEDYVLVVAHRGDWRNFPENSLLAIQGAIDMGVDIVEIDIHKTKDNHLVLIHDETIDRTMTGKGKVSDYTLAELKEMNLRNGMHRPVNFKIPTLEEAMLVAKDKILVNLDKCYEYFEEAYNILEKTGTTDQVIMKGTAPAEQVKNEFGKYLDKVYYMPIVRLAKSKNPKESVDSYLEVLSPPAFEFTIGDTEPEYTKEFNALRRRGSRVWVNSLWASHNASHEDNKAVLNLQVYDWFLKRKVNMIQTDRPQLLLNYLRSKGLHN